MSQQQLIMRPLGLITQPNKLGTFPPGALKQADGVFIRDPNIVDVAPIINVGVNSGGANTAQLVYLFAGPPNAPTVGKTWMLQLTYFSAAPSMFYGFLDGTTYNSKGTLQSSAGVQQNVDTAGRISSFISRNRQFINTQRGVLAFDHITTAPTARTAGLPPVCVQGGSGIGGSSPAYPSGNIAHYTAVIRRAFSDGYELVSAPAAATWLWSSGQDTGAFVYVSSTYHQAGDIVDLYRTKSQADDTNTGADYYLCASYTLTSADIAATNFLLKDYCQDATLGEALYTNPGQQGEQAAAGMPPQCKAMAIFKGHAFYLNCTDPPQIVLRVGTYLGVMGDSTTGVNASARAHGIGSRTIVGTITSGSPTITAVSAGDLVGIKVGQQIQNFRFNGGGFSNVIAVGVSSITVAHNATASAAGASVFVFDVIEIDGRACAISSAESICTLPLPAGPSGSNQADIVVQALDRVLPENFGSGITNPPTTFADGFLISRWFLQEGHANSLTIRATNGANYTPQLPELSTASVRTITETTRPNGLSWSEQNQPERVCPLSTGFAGSGEIYAAFSTRDALWIFASDGLWRLSGTGGSAGDGYDWRVDPVDSTLIISGPQAGCVLRDTVYAYTNRGFVSIDSSGTIRELSLQRTNDIMPGPQWSLPSWGVSSAMWMIADETHDEIQFTVNNSDPHVYVYNLITDSFTRLTVITAVNTSIPDHACYNRSLEKVFYCDVANVAVLTSSASSYGAHAAVFQPIYADNPFVMRHWQNLHLVLNDSGATQTVSGVVNGSALPSIVGTLFGDSGFNRYSWSIPRNAPAIANQISVGFSGAGPNITQRRLFSAALDYVDLTDQRRKR